MPKPDFRKSKEERRPWTTQEVVTPEPIPVQPTLTETPPQSDTKPAEKQVRTHARTHASQRVSTHTQQRRTAIEGLYQQIQTKKHLSSYTFRYRTEELDELEQIFHQVEEKNPGKLSRNDIARLALNALFEDYRTNGDASTLAQVLARM